MSAFLAIILFQTLYLIPSFYAYKIKVRVETAADEGNEETDVYLTLMGPTGQKISEEKKLGKFEEGEVRVFEFTTDSLDLVCLKFTLKEGTDGWTMEKSTVVLESGVTYTYTNLRGTKLDNTFWFQENSVDFCLKSIGAFELVDKDSRNVEGQHEGLLLFDGGTVCDDDFSDYSAKSICIAMGRPHSNVSWTSYLGGSLYGTLQSKKHIRLDKVKCSTSYWYQCSFSTTPKCKHEEDVFLTCGDGTAAKGLVTTTVVIIIAVIAVLIVAFLICLVVCCKRRKRANQQQSRPEAAPFTLDVQTPSSSAPSAPPAYNLEMAPTAAAEALPSYDEVAASPNRFKSRSSISRISSIFRKNNG
ncbi:uncharacterized protein LOC134814696 [Bolinopsis microptera]|uniref:uncharacterized protein LOC134814696 n=1 Tax=Bolinopsis microptera TaxID=2820187 RepID=UPI003079247A